MGWEVPLGAPTLVLFHQWIYHHSQYVTIWQVVLDSPPPCLGNHMAGAPLA